MIDLKEFKSFRKLDRKQSKIFQRICDKFSLSYNNIFIQYRNLNEFSSFNIERINPNHRLELYGKLRKSNKIIRVGEILLSYSGIILYSNSIYYEPILNVATGCILYSLFTSLFVKHDFKELIYIYANWYRRRRFRFWKNNICSKMLY